MDFYEPTEQDEQECYEYFAELEQRREYKVTCYMCRGSRTATEQVLRREGWVLGRLEFCPVDAGYADYVGTMLQTGNGKRQDTNVESVEAQASRVVAGGVQ